MCERLLLDENGWPVRINLGITKAWRVGYSTKHTNLYYDSRSAICAFLHASCLDFGKVMYGRINHTMISKQSCGGNHVFKTKEAAECYAAGMRTTTGLHIDSEIITFPVYVWGDAYIFEDGYAVEFLTATEESKLKSLDKSE